MKRTLLVASVAACLVVSTLRGSSDAQTTRYFGIYPAEVVNNQDPLLRARLLVKIPAVSTTAESWALPSAPYMDGTVGSIKLPPPGSEVWVEFLAGEPTTPVWVGWRPR
jgi:Type VI secretion system/phage-baseplate injector OB domain